MCLACPIPELPTQCGKINQITWTRQLRFRSVTSQNFTSCTRIQRMMPLHREVNQERGGGVLVPSQQFSELLLPYLLIGFPHQVPNFPALVSNLQGADQSLEAMQNATTGHRMWIWGTQGLFPGRYYDAGRVRRSQGDSGREC